MRYSPLALAASFIGMTMTPTFLNMDDNYRPTWSRRSTGRRYPHSSTRQRARYARQIAAGQIRN